MRMRIGQRLISLRNPFLVMRVPTTITWGLTNRTPDNRFVVFLDFDTVEYNTVLEEISMLQRNFNAGTALVRTTHLKNYKEQEVGSYHVFFFTKFSFPAVERLISLTRCDSAFKFCWKYNQQRVWVLRIGEKVSEKGEIKRPYSLLKEVVVQKKNGRQRSSYNALIGFFEKLDNIRLKQYFTRLDKSKEVETIRYTASVH